MSNDTSTAQQTGAEQPRDKMPPSGEAGEPGPGSISEIREILFGSQVRDYDRRLSGLEDRMVKGLIAMQEETRRRFDAFEAYMRGEVDALSTRLRTAQQHREDMNEDWGRRLGETVRSIEKNLSQLDENTAQAHRDLRQQILDQSKNLSDEIRSKYSELASALAREAQGIRSEKTDRSALASFFGEIAKRLDQDPT